MTTTPDNVGDDPSVSNEAIDVTDDGSELVAQNQNGYDPDGSVAEFLEDLEEIEGPGELMDDSSSSSGTSGGEAEESGGSESEVSAGEDSYFGDDEKILDSYDEILHFDEDSVTAKQESYVVSWDIDGLYGEEGKVRSRWSLRNKPPVLRISNSDGEKVEFILTRKLTGILSTHLENAHRAYYGIKPKSEMNFRDKINEVKTGLRANMGKTIVVGGILTALLIFGIFF